jgi:hypothetical protein
MQRSRLTTREASEWLLDHAGIGTPATLEVWRCKGVGPSYRKVGPGGRRVVYDLADLEAFAAGRRVEIRRAEPAPDANSADIRPAA